MNLKNPPDAVAIGALFLTATPDELILKFNCNIDASKIDQISVNTDGPISVGPWVQYSEREVKVTMDSACTAGMQAIVGFSPNGVAGPNVVSGTSNLYINEV